MHKQKPAEKAGPPGRAASKQRPQTSARGDAAETVGCGRGARLVVNAGAAQ